MIRNRLILFCVLLFVFGFMAGCEQIKADYKLGKETPLAQGEVSPQQRAQTLANTTASIPYVQMATPVLLLGLPYVFTWLRGRRLRKETMMLNEKPITGALGNKIGAEAVVQHLANVAAGLFEVGPAGSSLKRGWKVTILSGIGAVIAPEVAHLIQTVAIPFLENTPPNWLANLFNGTALALSIGGLAAVEKWLSKVEPLKESPATI